MWGFRKVQSRITIILYDIKSRGALATWTWPRKSFKGILNGAENVLGKGLGAIFPDLLMIQTTKKVFLAHEELRPNRYQPGRFSMMTNKGSCRFHQNSGIIQRLLSARLSPVMKLSPEKGAGGRQAAGLKDVPVVIREATDLEAAEISLIENIQREELNPLEEADAYVTLIEKFKLSQEAISIQVARTAQPLPIPSVF